MMKIHAVSCILAVTMVPSWTAPAAAREWTSSDGKHRVEAELIEITDGVVRLKRQDGKVLSVPATNLSKADRDYLASLPKNKQTPVSNPQDEKALKQALRDKGIRASRTGFSLRDETNLSKGLRGIFTIRKALLKSTKQLAFAENRVMENKLAVTNLTQLNVQLNGQLATVSSNQVTLNNNLIGAINANNSQIQLLRQNGEQLDKHTKAAWEKANGTRERYIQSILDLRQLADSIDAQYKQLASDPAVKYTIEQFSTSTGKSYQLTASPSFRASMKRLKSLEDTVLSETIPLRVDPGGTLKVSVVIDGKHTYEMVLDSGASLISLPQKVAAKCGITVSSTDPSITLQLADGSTIHGKLVTIPSVRVGKFTAENVECAVLGADAISAELLLGMSFLGNFKFEINAQEGTLTMVKVETSDPKSTKLRKTEGRRSKTED